jgi:hypothetical protein
MTAPTLVAIQTRRRGGAELAGFGIEKRGAKLPLLPDPYLPTK